ncbi:MAG: hypothetical protein D6781_03795 [Verrucomicrobia bacterium]|nr:MAG: hypothetical protein D6781_03795 [Verrucomicrobiota bacterium]
MIIVTLTANLLAETTYTFDTWREGATQRAKAESFQVGGKGINVTRMLTRMGAASEALLFSGGATGVRCEAWLREHAIPFRAFRTPAETRTGAVVRAPGRAETTFLGAENEIAAEAIAACADSIRALPAEAVLTVSGSIPAWTDSRWDPLRAAIESHVEAGRRLYVDTYGPPLAWFGRLPATLVKINRAELAGLVGESPEALTEARMPEILTARLARDRPAAWIITDGPNPVWCASRHAAPFSIRPESVEEVSPTGSGDVFMAGCLYGIEVRGWPLEKAVAFALPLASANAASPGVAEFDLTPFGLPEAGG